MPTPKMDHTFIDLPNHINRSLTKELSLDDIEYDKQQVVYTLNTAYSGRKFLPGNQYKNLLSNIESIQGPLTAKQFCEALNEHFSEVSDAHLGANINNESCVKTQNSKNIIQKLEGVGENYYKEKDGYPWDVRLEEKKGQTAMLISITFFPPRPSPEWNGFLDRVKKLLHEAHFVIIDLRGNGGGDDRIGHELSSLLAGTHLKTPYSEQWTNYHPSSFQVMFNFMEYWSQHLIEKNKQAPQYLNDYKKKFLEKRDKLIRGEKVSLSENSIKEKEMDFNYEKSIKKPIYILMDSRCGSSGESTIDFFEFNTLVKKIGENTAGLVHFGNNGGVVLKHSGVMVRVSISFNRYYDGRFIEKIGIAPDIKVPPGEDAMFYAWEDFFKGSVSH